MFIVNIVQFQRVHNSKDGLRRTQLQEESGFPIKSIAAIHTPIMLPASKFKAVLQSYHCYGFMPRRMPRRMSWHVVLARSWRIHRLSVVPSGPACSSSLL
jgi:hypothetical protein